MVYLDLDNPEPARSPVDTVIESDQPLNALYEHFGDRRSALVEYARRMSARYRPDVAAPVCGVCREKPPTTHLAVNWLAGEFDQGGRTALRTLLWSPVILLSFAFRIVPMPRDFGYDRSVAMTTHHAMCRACRRWMRVRFAWAFVLSVVFAIGVVLAAVCLMAALAVIVSGLLTQPRAGVGEIALYVLAAGASVAGLLGMVWLCRRGVMYIALPPCIWTVGRRPFSLSHKRLFRI